MEMVALHFGTFLCFLGCVYSALGEPTVKLDVGSVRGTEMKSEKFGKTFYAFRGIPYAEPPIDKLRFKPPAAKLPWGSDVLDATQDGPICPQFTFATGADTFMGQEDNCLVLNVYTGQISDISSDKLRPVIFYIYPGAFMIGSGSSKHYGPTRLLDNDVVLVTINYRVGTLGFLSTADSESPGNYGMLDQVEALKWVNKHIKRFGGDAKRVMIMGNSAGGASVTYHMLSPLSKGLFQRAVAISGAATAPWAFQPQPLVWAQKVGIEVGCPIHDTYKMMKCLRHVSAENLTRSGITFNVGYLPITMVPTVDNYFLLDTPKNLLDAGKVNGGVEFMAGFTKDECSIEYAIMLKQRGDERPINSKKDMKLLFKDMVGTTLHNYKAVDLLYDTYIKDLDVDDVEATREVFIKVNSEGLINIPVYSIARSIAKAGVKTYVFNYDFQAPFSTDQAFGQKEIRGVSHLDDLFMVFTGEYFDHAVFDEPSEKMKTVHQSLLLNFAKEGDPVPETSDVLPVKWHPAQPNELWVYHIDQPLTCAIYDPKSDPSFEFWTEKIPKALKESTKVKPKEKTKDEL